MTNQLLRGQSVTVVEFGGNVLKRVVLADRGRAIVVCNPQEFHRATEEKRQPEGIGFPRKDVQTTPSVSTILY